MRNKNYGYIYQTTNLKNKKIYIGQRKGNFNSNYLGSGALIKKAIEEDGKSNFQVEIICYAPNKKVLNENEIFYISTYRKILGDINLYNLANGGVVQYPHLLNCQCVVCKNRRGERHEDNCSCLMCKNIRREKHKIDCQCGVCKSIRGEHKLNCQCCFCKARRGEYKGKGNPFYDKTQTEKTRDIIRQCRIGQPTSHRADCTCPFCKTKRRETFGENNNMFGKHQDETAKEKMKIARVKLWKDPEYRQKVLHAMRKKS